MEGNDSKFMINSFEKVEIQDTMLYTRQLEMNGQRVRMVFLPSVEYELDKAKEGEEKQKVYESMVKRFFLLNMYMKSCATTKIKLISLCYLP